MGSLFSSIEVGLATALMPTNLLVCFVGVLLGMLIGVIPGLGPLVAITLLFPYTLYLDPTSALIMLAGIYYGTAYGGSIAAILLNLPGTPSTAVTCIDGFPMCEQGRAGVALFLAAIASFVAGTLTVVLMVLVSPLIAAVAIEFRPAEFFSLMALGLVAASTISGGEPLRGLAMVTLGVLLGCVGPDRFTGVQRMTFGTLDLADGISLIAVAMGLFGVVEVINSISSEARGKRRIWEVTMRSMVPTSETMRRSWRPMLRGTAIGSFFGALPGTGASIASYMAYALERNISRDPGRFGKGAVEGVCAPEAANNAADQTSFVPTLTLGVPGSATMALMLGIMIIHGITPGPKLVFDHPDVFWGLITSFWVGNLMLLVLSIPLIGVWIQILRVPSRILYPAIVTFICIGVYSVNNSYFDVGVVVAIGGFAYLLSRLGFSAPPLILGFVLGPLMEENFRRSMILSYGDLSTFLVRPISGSILLMALLLLLWAMWSAFRQSRAPRIQADPTSH